MVSAQGRPWAEGWGFSLQNSQKVDRLDGAHAPELTQKVQRHAAGTAPVPGSGDSAKEELHARLKKLINAAPCMLFMKGSPKEPRCGEDFLEFLAALAAFSPLPPFWGTRPHGAVLTPCLWKHCRGDEGSCRAAVAIVKLWE